MATWYNDPCEGAQNEFPYWDQKGPTARVQVVGRPILKRFVQMHSEVGPPVDAWLREALAATWRTPADIKARYVSASFLANNRVIFNLKGKKYRLDTKIAYQTGVVIVKRIGTHTEYDRWSFDD